MKKYIFPIVNILFIVVIISCSNDSDDDDMLPPSNNDPVTYQLHVKPIIDGNCLNCHGNPTANNAPMSLTTYTEVKNAVQTRGLIVRVENGSMPLTGNDLSASQVQTIKDWRTDGYVD